MKGLALKDAVDEVPVVVAGAGPAGLTAAITLARTGVETLVIERRARPSRVPRATAISTSTMELVRSWRLERHVREGELGVEVQPWVTETLVAALDDQRLDARSREGDRGGEAGRPGARHDHRHLFNCILQSESFHQTHCPVKMERNI